MAPEGTPVVFVHGLWLHADSWGAWVDRFRETGYTPIAPGWPGDSATVEETRKAPEGVAGHGIDDVVEHYAAVIRGLPAKPIVIGHSFGGLIAQRLLGEDLAAAAVGIDAAPIKGVVYLPLSALRVASIALRSPANKKRAVALTASSSATASAMLSLPPSQTSSISAGRFRRRANRSSKLHPRTSRRTRPPR
jgi:non-heme chloroperoxidase